jgi:hypothetical protein
MVLAIEPGEMPNTIGKLVDFIVKEEPADPSCRVGRQSHHEGLDLMSTEVVRETSSGQRVRIVQSASPIPPVSWGGDGTGTTKNTYTHTQSNASNVWLVGHDLGRYPAVTILDQDGNQVFAEVQHLSTAVVSIGFAAAVSGMALLT